MKRISMLLMAMAFFAISCSLTKENKLYRRTINGTWELTEVIYEGAEGQFTSTLFQDSDAKCFEGSTWFFNANNSLGYYSLPEAEDCLGGQRNIRWSVYGNENSQQLQFKLIDEKRNDITSDGFRLGIAHLDDEKMRLFSDVQVEGEPIRVVYKFQKRNQ